MRDVCAIVTERGAGCDGRLLRQVLRHRTKRWQRTAKSCGPGAATLALPAGGLLPHNGGKKGRSPGRARISRKTIARGKPGCLGCTCQIRVRSFITIAHGAAGAVGARLSLRPLFRRGTTRLQNSGKLCREIAASCQSQGGAFPIAHISSAAKAGRRSGIAAARFAHLAGKPRSGS